MSSHSAWKKLELTPESRFQDGVAFYNAIRAKLPIPHELVKKAATDFSSSLLSLSDISFADSFEVHSFEFRARGHAGGQRWAQEYGIINHSPIIRPEFNRAFELLDDEDRNNGRLLFDVLEETVPELHDLEYQSGPWRYETGRAPKLDWSSVPSAEREYYRALKRKTPRPWGYAMRPQLDMMPAISGTLHEMKHFLSEDGIAPSVVEPILGSLKQKNRTQGRILAKLMHWASGLGQTDTLKGAIGGAPYVKTFFFGAA